METDLRILEAEISALPELLQDWESQSEDCRLDWRWEWWDLMGRLKAVHRAYLDSNLTDQQAQRYEKLSAELVSLRSLIEKTGFPQPPVLLEV